MTYDEYCDNAAQLARQLLRPGENSVTAAAFGSHLRRRSPEETWSTFGKRTLLQFLEDLAERRRVVITHTEKGALALRPVVVTSPTPAASPPIFNPLRKAVWDAFVFMAPAGRRFLHRETGTVRTGLVESPAPVDEWVEIHPIASSAQLAWANEFVSSNSDAVDDLTALLEPGNWALHEFFRALHMKDEKLARRWNLFRSAKVSEFVNQWLMKHQVPPDCVFQSRHKSAAAVSALANESADTNDRSHRRDVTREAIIAALSSYPTETLASLLLTAIESGKAR